MAGPEIFDEILDSISYRFQPGARKAFNGGLSIQNVAGILCQVDDQGNVTPLLGGVLGGITNLTGDVTATGPGTVTATIGAKKVTYAKIQDVAANSFLGNASGSPASVTEISAASARTMLGLAAIATSGSAADLTAGTLPAGRFPALTGDVTTTAGSVATTVNIPATRIPFGDVSGHMTSSASLFYTAGTSRVTVLNAGATVPGSGQSALVFASADGTFSGGAVHLGAQSSSASPAIDARIALFRSRGTAAVPTTVANGDIIGNIETLAHDGNGYRNPAYTKTFVDTTTGAISPSAYMPINWEVLVNPNTAQLGSAAVMVTAAGDFVASSIALSTNAQSGFTWLPRMAGSPTLAPLGASWANTAATLTAIDATASVVDSANRRLYFYVAGAWHYAPIDDGAAAGITQLTGDGTAGPGTGSQVFTLDNTGVTPGSYTSANLTVDAKGRITLISNGAGGGISALTGDVTASGSGSVGATIAANAVTFAKMQTIADQRIIGNASGGTAVPAALTAAQVQTLLTGAFATGVLGVTTTTGALNSSPLTNTDVMFATGPNTVGQDANFSYDSSAHVLTVPSVIGNSGSHILTLKNQSGGSFELSIGPSANTFTGDVTPASANTYNLGGTGAEWLNVVTDQVSGNAGSHILTLKNVPTSPATVIALGSSEIDITGNVVPIADQTYDLGAATTLWNRLHVASIAGDSIAGGVIILDDSAAPVSSLQVTSTYMAATTPEFEVLDGHAHTLFMTGVNTLGFFVTGGSGSLVGQQTGGAATAGGTYTAAEQGMINRMYTALRAYGLLT